jgi:hypothetical protein
MVNCWLGEKLIISECWALKGDVHADKEQGFITVGDIHSSHYRYTRYFCAD